MKINFTKMHGLGNDFVVINKAKENLPTDLSEFSKKISDRNFGVGCDQVLFIDKSETSDFKMLIFNADGGEVEMCGNGIRCLAKYVYDNDLIDKKDLEVETLAGIIRPKIVDGAVRVDMGEPKFDTDQWIYDGKKVKQKELKVDGKNFNITLVSMGNPHCVIFTDKITDNLVLNIGPKIETHKNFPENINVEFVKVINKKEIKMRVWESGAGETLACGTGACASAIASMINDKTNKNITVHLKGGDLDIKWADNNHVFMTGPAKTVFEGVIKW